MSRKGLIKSRVNINNDINKDFSMCLGEYLNSKKTQSKAPFLQSSDQILTNKEANKYKKSLIDWRNIYSENKFKKSNPKSESLFSGKQNQGRPRNTPFSFAKSTFSNNNLKKQNVRTPSLSCRKLHSSFSTSKQKRKSEPFDPTLTPFILVQNIYESSVNNFEQQKRAQTARIRQYYERKAEKVQEFQLYDKLESKVMKDGPEQAQIAHKKFMRSGNLDNQRKQLPIYQRKNRRIIMPNEYFKDCNRVKISRRNVFRDHSVQTKQ